MRFRSIYLLVVVIIVRAGAAGRLGLFGRVPGHSVALREPASKIRHAAALAAERPVGRVDPLPATVHAEEFGLRQTRSLYQCD